MNQPAPHSHTHEPGPHTSGRTIGWAQHYDAVTKLMLFGQDKSLRRMTAEMAAIRPGDRVLEVGCGTGELTIVARTLAGASGQVVGIDAAPEMIEVARAKAARLGLDIQFRLEAVEALSFADGSFDVALSSLMMHHLPPEVKRRGLAEVYRVLKPGGRLFIVDMKRPTGILERIATVALMHAPDQLGTRELTPLMQDAGFVNVQAGNTRFRLLGFIQGEVPR